MSLRSIEALVDHFKVTSVMDLLTDSTIREQIKHFRFVYQRQDRYITKQGDTYWCLQVACKGEWVNIQLDEEILSEFKIYEVDWLRLTGFPNSNFDDIQEEIDDYIKDHYSSQPEESKIDDNDVEDIVSVMFIVSTSVIFAGHLYRLWSSPSKKK